MLEIIILTASVLLGIASIVFVSVLLTSFHIGTKHGL